MDLNIILWIGGMLFSLGIFAVKVGFGLGFGRVRWRGVFLTLSLYLALFVVIAVLSKQLVIILEPVLKKGPYLHALMAMGMIAWGIYTLRSQKSGEKIEVKKIRNWEDKRLSTSQPLNFSTSSLFLLIPCPVCLTAIAFSTWAALSVIKLPSPLIGLGLGIVFVTLSLVFYFSLKLITHNSSLLTQKIGLGLSMIGIGLYFLASLFLPAKIEEARGMYKSFLSEGNGIALNDSIGVFILLFIAMFIGFFINKRQEVKK